MGAGYEFAALSLALIADDTVLDIYPTRTAVATAKRAAQERRLATTSFVQADITALTC
ncbi:hypothetical protein [Mycobacterium leprae]|uniref:hypothetical protein n=1 Tax=Mycobacterium leprae TaxID=1769 RepID=UPI000B0E8CB0|nr:hypothetical protein [Mycobacterium leprae]